MECYYNRQSSESGSTESMYIEYENLSRFSHQNKKKIMCKVKKDIIFSVNYVSIKKWNHNYIELILKSKNNQKILSMYDTIENSVIETVDKNTKAWFGIETIPKNHIEMAYQNPVRIHKNQISIICLYDKLQYNDNELQKLQKNFENSMIHIKVRYTGFEMTNAHIFPLFHIIDIQTSLFKNKIEFTMCENDNDVISDDDMYYPTDIDAKIKNKKCINRETCNNDHNEVSEKNDHNEMSEKNDHNEMSEKNDHNEMSEKNNNEMSEMSEKNNNEMSEMSEKNDQNEMSEMSEKNDQSEMSEMSEKNNNEMSEKNDHNEMSEISEMSENNEIVRNMIYSKNPKNKIVSKNNKKSKKPSNVTYIEYSKIKSDRDLQKIFDDTCNLGYESQFEKISNIRL
jgi:hypothetical protein